MATGLLDRFKTTVEGPHGRSVCAGCCGCEDGPGYRHLRATCPGNGLAVCAFVDRLPPDHEQFMWAYPGLFATADPEMRRKLSAEQVRYALNVLRYDPLGQSAVLSQRTARA